MALLDIPRSAREWSLAIWSSASVIMVLSLSLRSGLSIRSNLWRVLLDARHGLLLKRRRWLSGLLCASRLGLLQVSDDTLDGIAAQHPGALWQGPPSVHRIEDRVLGTKRHSGPL